MLKVREVSNFMCFNFSTHQTFKKAGGVEKVKRQSCHTVEEEPA